MLYTYAKNIEDFVLENDTITIKDVMTITGDNSTLLILVFLSVLNIILSPLPVNSFVLGIPLFAFSVFYLLDWDLADRKISLFEKRFDCVSWRKYISRLIPYFSRFEKLSAPRWHHAMILENRMFSGLCLALLALIIFLPIPFANIPGSIGMIFVSLGILQRDGVFVFLGYFVFFLHIAAILSFGHLLTFMG